MTAGDPSPPLPPFAPESRRPINGLAIVSFIAACAQVLVPFLAGLVAIVCGHLARRRIRRTGEGGRRLALAGLLLGYLGVAAIVAIVGLFAATGIPENNAKRHRVDNGVADVAPERLGRVVSDVTVGTGLQLDVNPSRTLIVVAPGSSAALEAATIARLRAAGFTPRGLTSWDRRTGGFVVVSLVPIDSAQRSVNVDGRTVRLPAGAAIQLEFHS